jgi:phosphatidate phosphatase APP1
MIHFSFLYLNPFKNYTIYCLETSTPESFEDVAPSQFFRFEQNVGELNAFFTSQVEWNLYRFLVKFTEIHKLPKAVLLLKEKLA